jgi:ATP-dependent RNA helicase DHX37/DHR1
MSIIGFSSQTFEMLLIYLHPDTPIFYLTYSNDPNALILPSKADAAAIAAAADGTADGEAPLPQKKLSKSQQRKLRKVQEEKDRREKRAEIYDSLSKHQLVGDQLGLLRPASARGQKVTKKEGLRRALQLHRAGVDLPSDTRLFKKRKEAAPNNEDGMDGVESEDDSSSDDEVNATPAAAAAGAVGQSKAASKHSNQQKNKKTSEDIRALGKWNDKPKPASLSNTSSDDGDGSSDDESDDDDNDGASGHKAKKAKTSSATELRSAVDQAKAEIGDAAIHMDEDEELTTALTSKAAAAAAAAAAVPHHVRVLPRVVLIQRTPEIQAVRTNLPIIGMEQEIMESIAENDVIVLCGETGCGKTTQVPQFLYEAGYGCSLFPERAGAVGVTQPRRVAAVSTARRVAEELGSKIGNVVGYQVRYDAKLSTKTCLKFMTDGILLREVQEDFLLRKYSAIVVDEAHERSLNTDILLGMLSRIVTLRRTMSDQQNKNSGGNGSNNSGVGSVHPLKLIIMSATLRTEDFVGNSKLFSRPPPVVSVPARQYPVTVHFSRKTELHDYVGAAHKKVCQIHRNLPPGGVLVFLTGQREVEYLCRKLRQTFAPKKAKQQWNNKKHNSKDTKNGGGSTVEAPGQQVEKDDGDDRNDDDDDLNAATIGGGGGGSWSGAGEDAAEADAAAIADEAYLLSALDDERSGAADRDDFDATINNDEEGSGDEEEVVILGGEGFTAEQIAEAEEKFDQQLGNAAGQSLTAVAADAAKTMKDLKSSIAENGKEDEEGPVHVLPLYAMLPPAQQARVFQAAPPGARLIIVATNVAETSLTIPGVRYVVDAGRSKQRLLENASGLARFDVRWVSKASAQQRAGRAGRTGPGHCYRLFSSAHYNDTFPEHTPPEIVNTALEGVALSLKALGVDKVANFPFPTPPEPALLSAAEQCLIALGALDPVSGRLTSIGVAMAKYPISPRHSRMLLEALRGADDENTAAEELLLAKNAAASSKSIKKKSKKLQVTPEEVLRYAEGLAAVLSVESPFINLGTIGMEDDDKKDGKRDEDEGKSLEERAQKAENDALKEVNKKTRESARLAHARLRVPESDALSALCALCAFEAAGESETFCRDNHLLFKNLREAAALRKQLSRIVAAQRSVTASATPPSAPPPQPVLDALRRAVAAGWGDHVARRVRSLEHVQDHHHSTGKKSKRAVRYKSCTASLEEDIFLHPNSALHSSFPDFVVYSEIVRTVKRPYMAGLTAVEPRWLATAAAPMCNFSSPLLDPPPFYNASADTVLCWQDVTFGSFDWPLPKHAAPHPDLSERCAVFAAALLEGKIASKFADLKSCMAAPASMASKPEMRVHKRVADLISALEKKKIDSKTSLAAVWKKDSNYLKKELEAWMQKGASGKLQSIWQDLILSVITA